MTELNRIPLKMRGMVIRITNALIEEGYRQDKALLIAIGQAEEGMQANRLNYHVTPHPLGWVVRHPDSAQPCLVFHTRDEAIQVGRTLAEDGNANLVIHKDSGEVHTKFVYH